MNRTRPTMNRFEYELVAHEGFHGEGEYRITGSCLANDEEEALDHAQTEHEAEMAERNDFYEVTIWADEDREEEREFCMRRHFRCVYTLNAVVVTDVQPPLPEGWTGVLGVEFYEGERCVYEYDCVPWEEDSDLDNELGDALRVYNYMPLEPLGLQNITHARIYDASNRRSRFACEVRFTAFWQFENSVDM